MAMTVVVTRSVPLRFRGFLASCMLEIGPGIYTSPRMTKGVRERVWAVCCDWFDNAADASILMTWQDEAAPGGQRVVTLGTPPVDLRDHEGVILARSELPAKHSPKPSPP